MLAFASGLQRKFQTGQERWSATQTRTCRVARSVHSLGVSLLSLDRKFKRSTQTNRVLRIQLRHIDGRHL